MIQLTGATPATTRTVTVSLAASGKAGRPVAIRATKKNKVALALPVPAKATSVVVTLADSATS